MFLNYYGLREEPFGVTPDPRFLYLTPSHREAQATLDYGIKSGRGFAALVARPGMGKTTLLFHLLQRYAETAKTAFLFQTQCDSREFMRYLLVELGFDLQLTDVVQLHDEFNRMLVRESRAGRRIIIVVDEAQNLSPTVLETVRLLSDFETPRSKLLHIILAGQPELADKLATPALAQLRQRITHLVRLDGFSRQQTDEYIEHRLRTAGYAEERPLFSNEARAIIHERGEGVPRIINNLCFNALSLGFVAEKKTIDAAIAQEASVDLDIDTFNWQVRGMRPARAVGAPLYESTRYLQNSVSTQRPATPAMKPLKVMPVRAAVTAMPPAAAEPVPAVTAAPAPAQNPALAVEAAASSPQPVAETVSSSAPVIEAPADAMPTMEASVVDAEAAPQLAAAAAAAGATSVPFEIDLHALAQDYALLEMEALRRMPAVPVPVRVEREPAVAPEPAAPVAQLPETPEIPVTALPSQPERSRFRAGWRKYFIGGALVIGLGAGWQFTRQLSRGTAAEGIEAGNLPSAGVASASVEAPVVIDDGSSSSPAGVVSVINVVGEVPNLGHPHVKARIATEKTDDLVRRVDPIYPEAAKDARLQGRVVIDGAVVPDGSIHHLRVISGDPLLAQSAIDAIKGWRYRTTPGRGKKASDTRITVNFVLAENPRVASAGGGE